VEVLKTEARETAARLAALEGTVASMQENQGARMTQMEEKVKDLNAYVTREVDYY
jgi:hypothetical protein